MVTLVLKQINPTYDNYPGGGQTREGAAVGTASPFPQETMPA